MMTLSKYESEFKDLKKNMKIKRFVKNERKKKKMEERKLNKTYLYSPINLINFIISHRFKAS